MPTLNTSSGKFWLSGLVGFLCGFLLVYGWQLGAGHPQPLDQTPGLLPASSVSTRPLITENNRQSDEGSASPSETSPLEAANALVFQSAHVENQLRKPISRLEKFLQQCELKAAKPQQVDEPDGDSILRIEVPPFRGADVEAFWELAEKELLNLEPGLQPYFIARVENLQRLFLSHLQDSGVLFVKQLGTRIPDEPSVQYWFFQTSKPDGYVLHQDGTIGLPAYETLPPGQAWFDHNSMKLPPRLKHLAGFKYN